MSWSQQSITMTSVTLLRHVTVSLSLYYIVSISRSTKLQLQVEVAYYSYRKEASNSSKLLFL